MSEMTIEHESVAEPAASDEQLVAMLVDRARSEGMQLTGSRTAAAVTIMRLAELLRVP
ncbi:hypothetical protein [Streptomyces sp. NPDC055085]